ncbi:MAG: acyl-CoA dehydrogenase family protein [Actinomycetota bacterium]
MDFGLNDDQEMLARYARDFLTNEAPSAFVREQMDSPTAHDPAFYQKMAGLGWMGIAIGETYGGQGMSYVDVAVLVEEMGRALVPGPFFSTVCLATPLIVEAGSEEQKAKLLGDIAAGQRIATVAYTEPNARLDAAGVQLAAIPDGDGYTLRGTKSFVPDAHVADTLIVAARTSGDGITLFVVDAAATQIAQLKTMDMTRRWCDVTFDDVKVGRDAVMGEVDGGWAPLETALQRSMAMICAESVGGAQKVLDMSVEYSKVRVQFGRPIGSFQAVKHKCADMLVDVEMARSAMYYAAWAASGDSPEVVGELPLAASVAKAYCGDAYSRVALTGILVHGGIGFTWEHDLHLYYKRAKANELFLGDPVHHRGSVAALIAT